MMTGHALRNDDRQVRIRIGPAPSIFAASSSSRGMRHEVLAQQEDVVGVREEGRNEQRQPGAHPAEVDEDRVGRDECHRRGQEDRRQQQQEQEAAAREAEAGEAVGDQRARDDACRCRRSPRAGRVLSSRRGKLMRVQTSAKLPHCGANSHGCSSARHEPCQVMTPASGSAGSMKPLSCRPWIEQRQLTRGAVREAARGRRRRSRPRTRTFPGRPARSARRSW